jgi:site-specific DNA recombinase
MSQPSATSPSVQRVALYARVSSDHQAKAATIDSQVAEVEERIASDGHPLDESCCFIDDGYSGGSLQRPALEQLRDAAYAGAIDRLYVHSPDRLARKYAYQVLLLEELTKAHVEVVFLNHAISDSPEGELLLQMQGMIAEYERAKILERSRRGKRHAARRGDVSVLSGAPYGYRYVSKKESGDEARYDIVEEDSRIAMQVFQWVGQEGVSIGEVCRRLHDQKVKTSTGKEWWDRATIWGMLRNPAYKGSAAFGKTRVGPRRPQLRTQRGQAEQPHKTHSTYATTADEQELIAVPALVSEALFDAVAEQLVENKQRYRQRRRGAKYLLQGLLKCSCCGYSYYGKPVSRATSRGKTRKYAYYRCIGTDAYRFGGKRICPNKQVRTDLLEDAVWEDVCSLLSDPARAREEYERRLNGDDENSSLLLKQHDSELSKLKRSIARLIDAYEDGLIDKQEFDPRIRQQKTRVSHLERERKSLLQSANEQAELHAIIQHLSEFTEQLSEGLESLDWTSKREVIRSLVKRVEIGESDVRLIYKVGPPPFVSGPAGGASLQHCLRRPFPPVIEHTARRPGQGVGTPGPEVRPLC